MNKINDQRALRALLRELETPKKVAEHLGVPLNAVHSQMRLFRIHLKHVELQQTIDTMMGEVPGMSVCAAADALGVSRTTARLAMREILDNSANSEEEQRIKAALKASECKPRIAAESLDMELSDYYEQMNEYGIHLPARHYNVAEIRRIVQKIRKERPGMGIGDISMLIKVSYGTLRRALNEPPSDCGVASDFSSTTTTPSTTSSARKDTFTEIPLVVTVVAKNKNSKKGRNLMQKVEPHKASPRR